MRFVREDEMVFITGGAYAGKSAFAEKMFPGAEVKTGYHRVVREQMEKGLDPLSEVRKLMDDAAGSDDGKQLVITSDEIGCGIVPMDAFEREYREMNGRVSCCLAEKAEQVYRVVCGVGTRIR